MIVRRLTLASLCTVVSALVLSAAPALAAEPEKPVTGEATAVTANTALLSGTVNPGSSTENVQYFFQADAGAEACTPELAPEHFAPESVITEGVFPTAEGSKAKVEQTMVGLAANTEYSFCIVVQNIPGEGEEQFAPKGFSVTFKTEKSAPTVENPVVTNLTPFSEALEATVNAENETTECKVDYGTTVAADEFEKACDQGNELVGGAQPVTLTASELKAGTQYFWKVLATNPTGKTELAPVAEFTTPASEKPTVASEAVTEATLTSTDASLEAKVNPNYQKTTYDFEYATSEAALGTPSAVVVPGAPPALELTAVLEEQLAGPTDLKNALTPGQVYFYRVVATNKTGTTDGAPQSFQALDLPVPTTGEAREVVGGAATFTGTVNPAGAVTTYYFSYISDAGYQAARGEGATDPYAKGASTPEATTTTAYAVGPASPLKASGLLPGTTYHYALIATNSVGTVTGPDATFTTGAPLPSPVALTGDALGITSGTATLTGAVETLSQATTASFEFGSVPYSGTIEGPTPLPGSGTATGVSFAFNGYLSPGTTYYYRVIATNEQGTTYGAERSFTTTPSPSAALSPVTPLLSTPGEVTPTRPKSEPPAKKCKHGTTPKHGKCIKGKAKPKKKSKPKKKKKS